MTIELLFTQSHQLRTFLLMLLTGAASGLAIHLAGLLHRRSRLLGMAADLLYAFALAGALGWILLASGEGLRLYGLLGLCIGGVLYSAGARPLLTWCARQMTRLLPSAHRKAAEEIAPRP